MKISVIIPVFQAARFLPALLPTLQQQSLPATEIIVIDSSSTDGSDEIARRFGCRVETIPKSTFNHGRTRNLGASLATGEILVFMTQDALPVDDRFLEELTRPVRTGRTAATYARQVPYPDATPPEVFARTFNYSAVSHQRNRADILRMGIKAFFFSNVASCILSQAFWRVGGFPDSVILNEDMLLCAKLLHEGASIAYQAESKVFHSHSYTLGQQFKRYFDIGVASEQAGVLLEGARASGEGLKFATKQLRYLVETGELTWIPRTVIESALKFTAYQLGRREQALPVWLKRKLSMHAFYWHSGG